MKVAKQIRKCFPCQKINIINRKITETKLVTFSVLQLFSSSLPPIVISFPDQFHETFSFQRFPLGQVGLHPFQNAFPLTSPSCSIPPWMINHIFWWIINCRNFLVSYTKFCQDGNWGYKKKHYFYFVTVECELLNIIIRGVKIYVQLPFKIPSNYYRTVGV